MNSEKVIEKISLSNVERMKIVETLRRRWKGFVFRRIASYSPHKNVRYYKCPTEDEKDQCYGLDDSEKGTELFKHISVECESFSCFTLSDPIRGENEPKCLRGKMIKLESKNHKDLDDDFLLDKPTNSITVPFCGDRKTKLPGDLVCMFFSQTTLDHLSKNPKNQPYADGWFICSDQFLRTWTLVMHDWHPTFNTIIPEKTPIEDREKALFDKLFSNNRLMTNGFRKFKLSLQQNNMEMSDKDSRDKFWVNRAEPLSYQVDNYCALVLIARYGYLPCANNVPNNKDNGPKRCVWDLAPNFISRVLRCGPQKFIRLYQLTGIKYHEESIPLSYFDTLVEPQVEVCTPETVVPETTETTEVKIDVTLTKTDDNNIQVNVDVKPKKNNFMFEVAMAADWYSL